MVEYGTVTIDCKGLNLLAVDSQTITGLFNRIKECIGTAKNIVACNCMWGDIPITPIDVFVVQTAKDTYICTASTLQVIVKNDDSVTINNMLDEG